MTVAERTLIDEINELREKKNAVILAHYYQRGEIQDIADFIGDSLELARRAQETNADIIVFAGVKFMAETAKILNPEKKVLHPNPESGCPMADMATYEGVKKLREEHPDAAVVAYVNTNADVKTLADVIVTSRNAVKVVKALKEDKIIFVPDQFLGGFVAQQVPEKEFILWKGFCPPHFNLSPEQLLELKEKYPDAKIAVHPECNTKTSEIADFVGSTSQIIEFATTCDAENVIIGTEVGLKHQLEKINPNKNYIFPVNADYCGTVHCCDMKKNTLDKIKEVLENETNEIVLPEEVIEKARKPLDRMLEIV
ncbi:quinolinate synthase NadA [Hydrogenivirga sp. 128-5-R1-1]|uniref:quinolinate synthase NadA n=1 Tax=Hydrogenivirga sp. 128-5-R1-1 TaxID=392423 RepID=UPI00015F19F1|nr:quinolinate synthase NadA [Hydrogenivirga sp. 128-5-R1-1]EDP73769.1 quinolinate synthetase [Hydrogenivirga sp. 128-5-R1-1]